LQAHEKQLKKKPHVYAYTLLCKSRRHFSIYHKKWLSQLFIYFVCH